MFTFKGFRGYGVPERSLKDVDVSWLERCQVRRLLSTFEEQNRKYSWNDSQDQAMKIYLQEGTEGNAREEFKAYLAISSMPFLGKKRDPTRLLESFYKYVLENGAPFDAHFLTLRGKKV